jgi:voltage-gated potassium channel
MMKRTRLREIIFEADTPAGKAFDVILIISVLISVTAVILESVAAIEARYGGLLRSIEWFFTILFTIEYILRLYAVEKSVRYAVSFFGIVDLLAFLPTYIGMLITGGQFFIIIRILRVLRIFRVFKLVTYIRETNLLIAALKASRRRILIFLLAVFTLVVILGAMMYIIEDAEAGFTSIPRSIYWAIVTLTTVGYGDISPKTGIGQTLAAVIMILGYSLIVVPTGFVSIAMSASAKKDKSGRSCPQCSREEHDDDALFCKYCGGKL